MLIRTLIALLLLTSLVVSAQASQDNAGIFSTTKVPPLLPLLSSLAPAANITEGRNGDSTTFTCEWPTVTVTITVDPHWDGSVQLAGMRNWISKFPADERDTPAVAALLRKIEGTVDCIGSVIRPGYDAEGKAAALVLGLAAKLEGFVFSHQSFYDAAGTKVIGLPDNPAKIQTTK